MPDSAERVFIVEDATNRSASLFSLTVKTVSGTGVAIPVASTNLLYSDGTNINLGIRHKGYITPGATYTTVNGDQVLVDTSGGVLVHQLQLIYQHLHQWVMKSIS